MAQLVFRLLTKPEMCSLNPVVDNFYLLSTVVKNRKQGFERLAQLKKCRHQIQRKTKACYSLYSLKHLVSKMSHFEKASK